MTDAIVKTGRRVRIVPAVVFFTLVACVVVPQIMMYADVATYFVVPQETAHAAAG